MLQITIPAEEGWDETKEEFVVILKEQTLHLEHSLVSLSKWESKWHKSFFSKEKKSHEEVIDYVRCMTLDKNVDASVYERLTNDNVDEINKYINDPMTATTFSEDRNTKGSRQRITSELIYYWMISLNIPYECRKWHLNRLLTLIRVCNTMNQPPKKMSRRQIMSRNAALNAARRNQLNTKG